MAQQCEPLPIQLQDKSPDTEPDCNKELLARKIYEEVGPATARILRPGGAGTGFFIEDGSRVVTNAHVANGTDTPLTVETFDHKTYQARIEKLDDINDLAILKLEKGEHAPHALKLGSTDNLATAGPLFAVGHPLGLRKTYISPGTFNEFADLGKYARLEPTGSAVTWLKTALDADPVVAADGKAYLNSSRVKLDMQTQPGNSGSAITDAQDRVVAVIADGFERKDLQKYSVAVPVEKVKDLLNSKDKFVFDYEKVAFARQHPVFTGVVTVGVGGLTAAFPRVMGSIGGAISAVDLVGRVTGSSDSSSNDDKEKDWHKSALNVIDIASESALAAGAVLSWIPATKNFGIASIGLGMVGELSEPYILQETSLRGIKRTAGGNRPPLYWNGMD